VLPTTLDHMVRDGLAPKPSRSTTESGKRARVENEPAGGAVRGCGEPQADGQQRAEFAGGAGIWRVADFWWDVLRPPRTLDSIGKSEGMAPRRAVG
jgi:hypothetical protein